MTALSLALVIPDPYSVGECDGGEETALNAQYCRSFLLAMESLLQEQWTHNFNLAVGSLPMQRERQKPTLTPIHSDAMQLFFPCRCTLDKCRAKDEVRGRVSVGGSASGPARDFIYRLMCHSRCSLECYPLTLALIDRFFIALRKQELHTGPYMRHMGKMSYLFAVLLMLTAKFRDDKFRSNRYYSQMAELPLNEWNTLELFVLKVLGYDVRIPENEYIAYEKLVLSEMLHQEKQLQIISNPCIYCNHHSLPCNNNNDTINSNRKKSHTVAYIKSYFSPNGLPFSPFSSMDSQGMSTTPEINGSVISNSSSSGNISDSNNVLAGCWICSYSGQYPNPQHQLSL